MKLQTQIPLTKAKGQIDYSSQILLLGSCFSENMGAKLNYFKFQNVQNPLGILFHPLAIEKLITKSIKRLCYTEEDIFFLNDRWHCYEAHSIVSHTSKEALLTNLNKVIEETYRWLLNASHLIVTLGTAWVYRHLETTRIVANCHKVPQVNFIKELLETEFITNRLENMVAIVRSINPMVQFIFTVSPVRHLKDGFVENQRSKAHLISAVHNVVSKGDSFYFPSYEIMMDELRDYRFYSKDMIHPSAQAIDYIWEKFSKVWINTEVFDVMNKVDEIQRGLNHRSFNPSGREHQKFVESIQSKIAYLKKDYSFMNFNLSEP